MVHAFAEIGIPAALAAEELAIRSNQHQVRDRRFVKVGIAPQHPETIQVFRVARTDVSVTKVPPTLSGKKPVSKGEFTQSQGTHFLAPHRPLKNHTFS